MAQAAPRHPQRSCPGPAGRPRRGPSCAAASPCHQPLPPGYQATLNPQPHLSRSSRNTSPWPSRRNSWYSSGPTRVCLGSFKGCVPVSWLGHTASWLRSAAATWRGVEWAGRAPGDAESTTAEYDGGCKAGGSQRLAAASYPAPRRLPAPRAHLHAGHSHGDKREVLMVCGRQRRRCVRERRPSIGAPIRRVSRCGRRPRRWLRQRHARRCAQPWRRRCGHGAEPGHRSGRGCGTRQYHGRRGGAHKRYGRARRRGRPVSHPRRTAGPGQRALAAERLRQGRLRCGRSGHAGGGGRAGAVLIQ
jgi:hypothetical protein